MTDEAPPDIEPAPAAASGGGDPIRLPVQVQAIADRFQALPLVSRLFIGLTVLDVIGRALGIISPEIYLSTDSPTTFVSAFLPREAFILLPALIVLRRGDAERATPLVVWGAIVVALRELLWSPTASLLNGLVAADPFPALVWFYSVGAIVLGLGWFVLGVGLTRLNPRDIRAPIAGLANVGLWLVVGSALFGLVATLIARPDLAGDPEHAGAVALQSIVVGLSMLGFASFVRAVLRGLEDPARTLGVTRLAAIGVLLTAALGFATAILSAFVATGFPFTLQLLTGLGPPLTLLSDVVGYTLVVVAFGLGFAAPLRPLPSEWEAAPTPA